RIPPRLVGRVVTHVLVADEVQEIQPHVHRSLPLSQAPNRSRSSQRGYRPRGTDLLSDGGAKNYPEGLDTTPDSRASVPGSEVNSTRTSSGPSCSTVAAWPEPSASHPRIPEANSVASSGVSQTVESSAAVCVPSV